MTLRMLRAKIVTRIRKWHLFLQKQLPMKVRFSWVKCSPFSDVSLGQKASSSEDDASDESNSDTSSSDGDSDEDDKTSSPAESMTSSGWIVIDS